MNQKIDVFEEFEQLKR